MLRYLMFKHLKNLFERLVKLLYGEAGSILQYSSSSSLIVGDVVIEVGTVANTIVTSVDLYASPKDGENE